MAQTFALRPWASGSLVCLATLMTSFARRAGFGLEDEAEGARLANFAIYWHYLALVWLVLFATFSLVR